MAERARTRERALVSAHASCSSDEKSADSERCVVHALVRSIAVHGCAADTVTNYFECRNVQNPVYDISADLDGLNPRYRPAHMAHAGVRPQRLVQEQHEWMLQSDCALAQLRRARRGQAGAHLCRTVCTRLSVCDVRCCTWSKMLYLCNAAPAQDDVTEVRDIAVEHLSTSLSLANRTQTLPHTLAVSKATLDEYMCRRHPCRPTCSFPGA